MLEETGHLVWTWIRVTLALAVACGVVLAVYGFDSAPFKLAAGLGVLLDLAALRALAREWSFQATGCWWWSR